MEELFHERSLQNDTSCSSKTCSSCLKEDGCSWCSGNANSSGSCQLLENSQSSCRQGFTTDGSQCPSVGADVVLRNVSGLLGAMVAVAIILNGINRFSNKRRSAKLRKSIFTLPVYVYPSREKKAAAVKKARELLHSQASMKDIEEGAAEATDDDDDDSNAVVTCTICLSVYEEEEVIKVLPCGHDFHSECLDSWLECKATCPLCKTPAFVKNRDTTRRGNAASPVHAHNPPPGAASSRPPSYRSSRAASLSSDQPRGSESGWGGSGADIDGVELRAMAIASPRSTPTSGNIYLRAEAVAAADEAAVTGGERALDGMRAGFRVGTGLVRDDQTENEMKTTCRNEGGSSSGNRNSNESGSGSGSRRGSRSESVPADDTGVAAANDAANPPNGGDAVGVGGRRHLQGADAGVDAGYSAPPSRATTTPWDRWRKPPHVSPGGPDKN